jgi:sugar lactone lactonase YvrE
MKPFKVTTDELQFIGHDLVRPECVLTTASGDIFCSHWDGGVTHLHRDGSRSDYLIADKASEIRPNGIALCPDGSFLLANLGESGGLYRLKRDGQTRPILTEIEGAPLPPTNFATMDRHNRIWLTVSTRRQPRARGYRADVADGFIVLIDKRGAQIVADGLGYTNEVVIDEAGGWLFVNETFGRRTSRFKLRSDGSLQNRETVAEYGPGTYPDGLALDVEGGLWITSIVSNRVVRIAPEGHVHIVLEDADEAHLDWTEKAFRDGKMDRPHLDTIKSRSLKNISSLAFGGPDLMTVYLGCLLGDRLAAFRAPIAGRPPVHWQFHF